MSVTLGRAAGDVQSAVRAVARQTGGRADGWTAMSTVVRTASTTPALTITAAGTGSVDDIALEVVPDYVVDGSFESPDNSPWGGTRSTTVTASGQYAVDLGARASYTNNEVVVPQAGVFELWGWAKTPAGASMTLGASSTGDSPASITISGQDWTQGTGAIPVAQPRFSVSCSTGAGTVPGMFCDDVSVTTVWDAAAPAVPAAPVHIAPPAPADPPAPPRPEPVGGDLPFDQVRVVGASSENSDGVAENVNSSGTGTIWHTRWSPSVAAPPHWITLEALTNHELTTLSYTPRQDSSWNGVAKTWRVLGAPDASFSEPVLLASGTWPQTRTRKVAEYDSPTGLRFVRLHIDTHHGDAPEAQFGTAAVIQLGGYVPSPAVTVRPDGGALAATAGGAITLAATGLRPNAAGAVTLERGDESVRLGELTVDDTRTGTAQLTIPVGTEPGEWSVRVTQVSDAEYLLPELSASAALEVRAAAVDPTPEPSATPTPEPSVTSSPEPSAVPTSSPPAVTDVYSTPGFHLVNGRHWHTRCESYSQTTRCFTDIWGTSVALVNGRWVQANGWVFNNITYQPSPRSLWASNPLGHTGQWTAADGTRWRTECDTALTGRGGCRSFTWGPAVVASQSAQGTSFGWTQQWRFNNMVRFG